MDLPSIKIEKWTIETAQMKHSARKYSMNSVAQTHLRKQAAEFGIADFREFLAGLQAEPEKYEQLSEPEREFSDLSSSVGVWASVAGCIKPYIQLEEWLTFDDKLVEKLSSAVQDLNPHWFEQADQADQEKKTSEEQTTSIEDSTTL